jgi:hypothetical protein
MAGWSMAGWSDGVATAFKQVEGGYLLQLNPSIFGRSRGYLVDGAKRVEIVEQIRQIRRNRNASELSRLFDVIFRAIGMLGIISVTSWVLGCACRKSNPDILVV